MGIPTVFQYGMGMGTFFSLWEFPHVGILWEYYGNSHMWENPMGIPTCGKILWEFPHVGILWESCGN